MKWSTSPEQSAISAEFVESTKGCFLQRHDKEGYKDGLILFFMHCLGRGHSSDRSGCGVKNQIDRNALAATHPAYAMLEIYLVHTACALCRAILDGEHHRVALLQ
jgi:hypothetical protein